MPWYIIPLNKLIKLNLTCEDINNLAGLSLHTANSDCVEFCERTTFSITESWYTAQCKNYSSNNLTKCDKTTIQHLQAWSTLVENWPVNLTSFSYLCRTVNLLTEKSSFFPAQLAEIRKSSFAALYCDNVPGVQVRDFMLLIQSNR